MHDALGVSFAESIAHLFCDLQTFAKTKRAETIQHLAESFSLNKFHRDEGNIVGACEIENAANILVGDLSRDAQLVSETLHQSGAARDFLFQNFERNDLLRFMVARFENDAHTALTQAAEDFVSSREQTCSVQPRGGRIHGRAARRHTAGLLPARYEILSRLRSEEHTS